eukprot:154455-Hanusia_phi.AAC.1
MAMPGPEEPPLSRDSDTVRACATDRRGHPATGRGAGGPCTVRRCPITAWQHGCGAPVARLPGAESELRV